MSPDGRKHSFFLVSVHELLAGRHSTLAIWSGDCLLSVRPVVVLCTAKSIVVQHILEQCLPTLAILWGLSSDWHSVCER